MIGKLKTVVFDARDIAGLADFYCQLLGWSTTYADPDWATVTSPDGWRFGMQHAPDHQPPRWPDPAHPQQAHLDIRVPDVDATTRRAVELGATVLNKVEFGNTLADPAGHPFDLCHNRDDDTTAVYAVTIDCADTAALSRFYADLLGMRVLYEGDEGALIGGDGPEQVMFQRVEGHQAPQWPDPERPQQLHLDISVDDIDQAEAEVVKLGAAPLPGQGDNWRVYADPAGHPFCLLWGL